MSARWRLAVACAVLTIGCASPSMEQPVPEWLDQVIASIEAEPVSNPPSLIARYAYRGQTVYYRPPRCCDIASTLYDSTGHVMCGPDGGLTGKGDGRCADFHASRSDETIVWQDRRQAP